MVKILILEKEIIKEDSVDNMENLFKKCRFKKGDDFIEIEEWKYKNIIIKLFGKIKGKSHNKFLYKIKDMEKLIYGPTALISLKDNKYIDLNKDFWINFLNDDKNNDNKKIHDENSEDKNNDNEDEEDDNSEDSDKETIEKEDVDDEEMDEEIDEEEINESDEENIKIGKSSDKINLDIGDDLSNFSGSELAEEKYIYSSEEDN